MGLFCIIDALCPLKLTSIKFLNATLSWPTDKSIINNNSLSHSGQRTCIRQDRPGFNLSFLLDMLLESSSLRRTEKATLTSERCQQIFGLGKGFLLFLIEV